MCGIAGFIQLGARIDDSLNSLNAMLASIQHRGPDASGTWVDPTHGVALGHRRLSIIDLSPTGHQPMTSACGRYIIVFNGEIYNHQELRRDVKHREAQVNDRQLIYPKQNNDWRGYSDTETLLFCFAEWGIENTLKKTVGMFAIALWDKHTCTLTLARDRTGEKPIYYGWQDGVFLFGSELKALQRHSAFCSHTDWQAVSTFLRLNYIPAPYSIYKDIFKLLPGCYLQLNFTDIIAKAQPTPVEYWSLVEVVQRGRKNKFKGSFEEAVDCLEVLVSQAVKLQSVADVPLGAFLSGGIDSSTIVALMKSVNQSKITTFSIGVIDTDLDESKYAAAVARHLGTNHIEHIVKPSEALELIPKLSQVWDEPFADSSQIPTFLVSRLARQHVTVALSGDGGDEFFLGYPRYGLYQKLWRLRLLGKLPWQRALDLFEPYVERFNGAKFLRRSKSIVNAWRQPDVQMLHRYWVDRYRNGDVPISEKQGVTMVNLPFEADIANTVAMWDARTYLPDDIMVKVDRAAMANSLETRAPLLDHRIIEFASSLPTEYKLSGGLGKKVLREVLFRHVPRQIVERPKMGFSIPLSQWLKNELRSWAEDLLFKIPEDSELFDKASIKRIWNEHLKGLQDHTDRLWGIFNLVSFLK